MEIKMQFIICFGAQPNKCWDYLHNQIHAVAEQLSPVRSLSSHFKSLESKEQNKSKARKKGKIKQQQQN